MRTLVLGPNAAALAAVIGDDMVEAREGPSSADIVRTLGIEAIVSFGHRHIVPAEVLEAVDGRALNLHVSMLPWNRGADPNLWSWLEATPKGVSVHWMTIGLDRGEIAAQREVLLDPAETLRATYERLQIEVVDVLREVWPAFVADGAARLPQPPGGSYHRSADKEPHMGVLVDGWDTQSAVVAEYGRRSGLWVSSAEG